MSNTQITPGGVSGQMLGVDAVREFNVVSGTYGAENGGRAWCASRVFDLAQPYSCESQICGCLVDGLIRHCVSRGSPVIGFDFGNGGGFVRGGNGSGNYFSVDGRYPFENLVLLNGVRDPRLPS